MIHRIYIILFMCTIYLVPITINDVYGHGLGSDQAPPINFAGMNVTVSTVLDPSDITVGKIKSANMTVRFFDELTDINLDNVTYRIELWRSENLLARQLFYDTDGEISIEIRPKINCTEKELWKCTTYNGFKDPISGGFTTIGGGKPIITGPIFDKGGLYNIKVEIEGATSPKVQVAQLLRFETFVSVAQEQNFTIKNTYSEIPVIIKTYYDDITNFEYSDLDDSISFDMPFNWNKDYIELVQVVHEEIRIPKSFEPYNNKKFKAYINEIEINNSAVLTDPYSYDDINIIHFLVTGNELQKVNDKLGEYDKKTILFSLIPQNIQLEKTLDIKFDSGALVKVSWHNDFTTDDVIPLEFIFFDKDNTLLKNIRYGYSISHENGKELFSNVGNDPQNPGIFASEGIDIQQIFVPSDDIYTLNIAILGTGINYDQTYAGIGSGVFEIGSNSRSALTSDHITNISIPQWIKNNAGWWSEGKINDDDFILGIEFLVKENIINIPDTNTNKTTTNISIPQWIKNNAGWWSEGKINDDDFVRALQYLTTHGIILL